MFNVPVEFAVAYAVIGYMIFSLIVKFYAFWLKRSSVCVVIGDHLIVLTICMAVFSMMALSIGASNKGLIFLLSNFVFLAGVIFIGLSANSPQQKPHYDYNKEIADAAKVWKEARGKPYISNVQFIAHSSASKQFAAAEERLIWMINACQQDKNPAEYLRK